MYSGNSDQALTEINKALELDPLAMILNSHKGRVLGFGGKVEEAIAQYKKTIELFPDALIPRLNLAITYGAKGMHSEAFEQSLIFLKLAGANAERVKERQLAFEKDGVEGFVRKNLEFQLDGQKSILEKDKNAYLSSTGIARNYALLSDKDKTLEYLNKAYEQREPQMVEIKIDIPFIFMRDDPRFKDLLKRMGLSE